MIGTQKDDLNLMNLAIESFKVKARSKFIDGIFEHNPNGKKGMHLMDNNKCIESIQEEIVDLWFYVENLKNKISKLNNEKLPTSNKT